MEELTKKQRAVLDFIIKFQKDNGAPPTRLEIAKKMGSDWPNTATVHLAALQKKGKIAFSPFGTRNIKVL